MVSLEQLHPTGCWQDTFKIKVQMESTLKIFQRFSNAKMHIYHITICHDNKNFKYEEKKPLWCCILAVMEASIGHWSLFERFLQLLLLM